MTQFTRNDIENLVPADVRKDNMYLAVNTVAKKVGIPNKEFKDAFFTKGGFKGDSAVQQAIQTARKLEWKLNCQAAEKVLAPAEVPAEA